MIFYHWADYGSGDQDNYYSSLKEARQALHAYLRQGKDSDNEVFGEQGSSLYPIDIDRVDIGKVDQAKMLCILNEAGFIDRRETVEVWGAKACGKCLLCEDGPAMGCRKKRVVKVTDKRKK